MSKLRECSSVIFRLDRLPFFCHLVCSATISVLYWKALLLFLSGNESALTDVIENGQVLGFHDLALSIREFHAWQSDLIEHKEHLLGKKMAFFSVILARHFSSGYHIAKWWML